MLKRYAAIPLLCACVGGICLSASYGYNSNHSYQTRTDSPNHDSPSRNSYPNVKPGVSDEPSTYQESNNSKRQSTGREEVAYNDELNADIHRRANRRGDWGYKSNWRYDSKAFFKGETQGDAYTQEHPYGPGGIGYDPDSEYLQMSKFYKEDVERERSRPRSVANPRNYNNRSNNSNVNQGYDNGHYRNSNSAIQKNPNRSSYTSGNSVNSVNANYQRDDNRFSNSRDTNNSSYHRNEIGYSNRTSPSYPYHNDPDNNRQYDWSKQNTPRDYRVSDSYYPYYQEDNATNRDY